MGVVVHCQSDERGTSEQGHYYACDDCGWCSRPTYGDDSRLKAVLAGVKHAQAKADARLAPTLSHDARVSLYHQQHPAREWPAFIGFPAAVIGLAGMIVLELADRLTRLLHWDSR